MLQGGVSLGRGFLVGLVEELKEELVRAERAIMNLSTGGECKGEC